MRVTVLAIHWNKEESPFKKNKKSALTALYMTELFEKGKRRKRKR